ncbi:MAG: pentapeptide repeat-containing protein, partial [Cyanobacteria bacterium J06621_11]
MIAGFSGITVSLATTIFFEIYRVDVAFYKKMIWLVSITSPAVSFMFFSTKKNFLQGTLISAMVLMPLCFVMALEVSIPYALFDLLGVTALPAMRILALIAIGLISITLALLLARFFFRSFYIALFSLVLIASIVSFHIQDSSVEGRLAAAILSCFISAVGCSLSTRAIAEDKEYAWLKSTITFVSSFGRFKFDGVDLTDQDFSQANLINVDFSGATLLRTRWKGASGLSYARLGDCYLKDKRVRQLLTSLRGENESFGALNLEGVNLDSANLKRCQFVGTNLNFATLKNADLSGAVLKQSQLDGTDLSGATLTGSYIEDWGITGETNLEGIHCDYVFMRVPTEDNPNPLRKPDNWQENFGDDGFATFIKP